MKLKLCHIHLKIDDVVWIIQSSSSHNFINSSSEILELFFQYQHSIQQTSINVNNTQIICLMKGISEVDEEYKFWNLMIHLLYDKMTFN